MPQALYDSVIVADADIDHYQFLEGNVYFDRSTIKFIYLEASDKKTECKWKGTASYFHVVYKKDGKEVRVEDACWTYANPKKGAEHIEDHYAFWKGVEIKGFDPIDIIVRELKKKQSQERDPDKGKQIDSTKSENESPDKAEQDSIL